MKIPDYITVEGDDDGDDIVFEGVTVRVNSVHFSDMENEDGTMPITIDYDLIDGHDIIVDDFDNKLGSIIVHMIEEYIGLSGIERNISRAQ